MDKTEFTTCRVLYTKNRISQVLEYHRKLKKTKLIPSFYQPFGWKKDRISHRRKFQNKKLWVISRYHLSFNIFSQKIHFSSSKNSKKKHFLVQLTWCSMLKKISVYCFFIFFCRAEAPSFSFLKKYYKKIIFLPTSCNGKYFFCYRNP